MNPGCKGVSLLPRSWLLGAGVGHLHSNWQRLGGRCKRGAKLHCVIDVAIKRVPAGKLPPRHVHGHGYYSVHHLAVQPNKPPVTLLMHSLRTLAYIRPSSTDVLLHHIPAVVDRIVDYKPVINDAGQAGNTAQPDAGHSLKAKLLVEGPHRQYTPHQSDGVADPLGGAHKFASLNQQGVMVGVVAGDGQT
eukprot:359093-Chlamydomonas_euryale.AAC.2